MYIFNEVEKWDSKTNFVDSNNIFVGYDTSQQCCEHAGYFLCKKYPLSINDDERMNEDQFKDKNNPYIFDTEYIDSDRWEKDPEGYYDEDRKIVFKLYNKNNKDDIIFLCIYNSHNGYYSHGFVIKKDDKIIDEGSL